MNNPLRTHRLHLLALSLCVLAMTTPAYAADTDAVESDVPAPSEEQVHFFERNVRPLLLENCTSCHGVEQQEAELRLDSRAAMLTGGDRGPAIVPGSAEESLLMLAVRHDEEEDLAMPPELDKLSDEQIGALAKWINDGAAWPKDAARIGADTPSDRIDEIRESHWSFRPMERPTPPAVQKQGWPRNEVDHFILARQEEAGLVAAEEAGRRTLARRVYFDLIGLPPTPAEIDAFVNDRSDDAYERLIEQLLARHEYGQRWGRHWLDVVRYADTAGDASDYPVPEAYKYRNYVIDAFNRDLPYNEFVRQQIAGDLLPSTDDDDRWDKVVATGYITIARRIGVDPVGLRHITIENTIDNLGKSFLGLTLGCARCHNHKFDPIPASDYYALYGIFDSSVYPHAGSEHAPYRRDFVYRVGKEKAKEILQPYREELAKWDKKERAKFNEYQELQGKKTDPNRTRKIVWAELEIIREQRRPVAEAFPPLEIAYAVQEGRSHDVNVQKAGDPKNKGDVAPRGFLEVLGGPRLPDDHSGSGRLELAGWIADPENPLTARVMVNRIWHHHFGHGLVKSTSDFGVRGKLPTHPALLDYLATYFVDNGWSVKQMHRLIMTSRTYRLASSDVPESSAVDPLNDMLWRGNRKRLSAEQIRDSLLMFGGELDLSPGTRHPFPHHLTYFYRQHEPFNEFFPNNRRSVYMMQQRIQKNPFLDMFDGPDGNVQFAERRATTTTLQALFMMNSEFYHQRSDKLVDTMFATDNRSTADRVDWAYQTIFGRGPTSGEVERAESFLKKSGQEFADIDSVADGDLEKLSWSAYLRGMISSNEFLFVD